jgi:hypothetical protein
MTRRAFARINVGFDDASALFYRGADKHRCQIRRVPPPIHPGEILAEDS